MSVARGIAAFVGFKTEATYGVDPGSGYGYARIANRTVSPQSGQTQGDRGLGRLMRSDIFKKLKRGAGDFVFDAHYGGIEPWLLHFFGAVTTQANTPVASAHTHTFTPSLTRQVGLTVYDNLDLFSAVYKGAKLNRFRILMSNEVVEYTFGLIGLTPAKGSVQTPSYSTTPAILPMTAVPFACTLGGSAVNMRQIEIDAVLPHSEDREYAGDANMKEPVINGEMTVTGTLTHELDSDDWFDEWISGTGLELIATHSSGTTYITGTTPYTHEVKLYDIDLLRALPARVDGAGVMVEDIPFTARVDGTDSWYVKLVNGTTTVA